MAGLTGLDATERKSLFSIIALAVRTLVGHCVTPATVTDEQRDEVADVVIEEAVAMGLKRISRPVVLRQIAFWLRVNDPAKALQFGLADVTAARDLVSRLVPAATLDRTNAENTSKLGGRTLDQFVLSVALCGICKNCVVENRRTRKGEVGTKSIRELLKASGIASNGTLASLCFRLLSDAGLIVCVGGDFVIGKQCRRWSPAGLAWTIPFVAELPDADLDAVQRAGRDAFLAGKEIVCGDSHGIGSLLTNTLPSPTQQPLVEDHVGASIDLGEVAYQTTSRSSGDEKDVIASFARDLQPFIAESAPAPARPARPAPAPAGEHDDSLDTLPDGRAFDWDAPDVDLYADDVEDEHDEDWGPDLDVVLPAYAAAYACDDDEGDSDPADAAEARKSQRSGSGGAGLKVAYVENMTSIATIAVPSDSPVSSPIAFPSWPPTETGAGLTGQPATSQDGLTGHLYSRPY